MTETIIILTKKIPYDIQIHVFLLHIHAYILDY